LSYFTAKLCLSIDYYTLIQEISIIFNSIKRKESS